MDAISTSRLTQIHPEASRRTAALIAQLEGEGYIIRVTRGISTVAQQDVLWQEGRDTEGHVIDENKVVTNAKGTESNHVLGFAADLAIMTTDGQPDWNSPGFDRIAQLAPSHGLRSGASWGDRPHVELQEVPAIPSDETQQTYLQRGVQAVWAELQIPDLHVL